MKKNKKQMSGTYSCEKIKEVKMTKPNESQKDMVQG